MVFSWPVREGFFNQPAPIEFPETNEGRVELIKKFAKTWADPFRSLALSITSETEIKPLELYDWPPPKGLRTTGNVALVGDALHPMVMCKFSDMLLTTPPPRATYQNLFANLSCVRACVRGNTQNNRPGRGR